jgi:hypothetical protein
MPSAQHPPVLDPALVGTYPASVKAGGGYVWDAVLEYRVWCYPRSGTEDLCESSDYFYAFGSFEEATKFASTTQGAQEPIALVLQEEYIDEPKQGEYIQVQEQQVTEWPVQLLTRPCRTSSTIPAFLAPDAPANRLDIIRGLAPAPGR